MLHDEVLGAACFHECIIWKYTRESSLKGTYDVEATVVLTGSAISLLGNLLAASCVEQKQKEMFCIAAWGSLACTMMCAYRMCMKAEHEQACLTCITLPVQERSCSKGRKVPDRLTTHDI